MVDKLALITSDGARHDVSRDVAVRSRLIQSIVNPDSDVVTDTIPLAVTSRALGFVLKHFEGTLDTSALDRRELVATVLAANFLDVPDLVKAASRAIAALLEGRTTEQIREDFGISNDLSAEEEALVRRHNYWSA